MKVIVGLTGGIGSGKSTVLQLFKELGAEAYIADIEAKQLMNTNNELIKQIKKLLGEKAYKNNTLDRNFIATIVFNNSEKLMALNNLVHPKVGKHFKEFIKNATAKIIVYESAILFESKSNKMCDFIITVTASFEDKIERIIQRDNVSKQQILDRMKHQLNDTSKIKKSNFVIRNKVLEDTKQQVFTIYNLISQQI
ncbi:dephospho-CoA kinase [Lutibacter sp.]